jgi:hypothetical protein
MSECNACETQTHPYQDTHARKGIDINGGPPTVALRLRNEPLRCQVADVTCSRVRCGLRESAGGSFAYDTKSKVRQLGMTVSINEYVGLNRRLVR